MNTCTCTDKSYDRHNVNNGNVVNVKVWQSIFCLCIVKCADWGPNLQVSFTSNVHSECVNPKNS